MSARDRKQELLDSEPAAARAQRAGTLRGGGTRRDIPNARMLAPAHVNPVHAAHHWEQRLVQERKSAAEWKASWGFLEAEKPISDVLANVWDDANHSKLGPMHEFLAQTHRTKQAKLQGDATLSLASTARTPKSGRAAAAAAEPFASPLSSPTGKGASARPYTPTTPSSAARLAAAQNADANAGVSAVDKLPPLHLDAKTAAVLRPQLQQYTGASALTVGVDPIRKYRFPQTAAQMVGWQTAKRIQLLREAEAADGGADADGDFGATLSASASSGSLAATQRATLSATGGGGLNGTARGGGSGGGSTTRRHGARGYPPPSEAVQQLGLLSQSTALAATARPRGTQRGVGANGAPTATLHTGGGAWARAGLVTPAAAALYGTHAVQPGVAHPSGKMDHTAFWNHGLHNHNQAFWN